MLRARHFAIFTALALLALAAAGIVTNVWSDALPQSALNRVVAPAAIPLAVLGDSNSHSFQDSVSFPPGASERGGALRPKTFNWNEVVARLRPNEIDSGPWVTWGTSGLAAGVRDALGLAAGRAPRKEDYLYNFANSGANCSNLTHGRYQQAPRLVSLMNKEPGRWARGVVVIRIGLNDWAPLLGLAANDPQAPPIQAATQRCAAQIREAIDLIQSAHPGVRVLVVGISNEADDPSYGARFQSARENANIVKALGDFNNALKELAQGRRNTAYFDDDAWFVERWGTRDANGKPAYKTLTIGNELTVASAIGDDPRNTQLADHHLGLVFNALWAQSLIAKLREAFGLPLTPITDKEIEDFVLPLARPSK